MQQTFTLLSTVFLKHSYFKDAVFRPVEFSSDEETIKLLKDLDIIIKPFTGGLHVLATDPGLLQTREDEKPLRFYFSVGDAFYINYTELPEYRPAGNVLYFNNLHTVPGSQPNTIRLHINAFVGQEEVARLSNGKITVPEFNPEKEYRFSDALGNELKWPVIKQMAQGSAEFMLSNQLRGLIDVSADNNEADRFYNYPERIWKKPVGIVELYPGKLFDDFTDAGKFDYTIQFNARKTIWKYFLVSPVYQKFNKLSIVTKEKEQVFNSPLKQQVINNTEAIVIESKKQIPLAEHSNETYQLIDNYNAANRTGKMVLKNLPFASPEQLFTDGSKADENVYSHIYI